MVLEFLTAGHVTGGGVCLPGQNDEPEPPVVKNGTHRNQGVLPHGGPRARQVVRQQIERVDCIEIIDCNRDRAGPLFDKGACPPCCRKIVGGARLQDLRTFDSGNAHGGDQKKLRRSVDVLSTSCTIVQSASASACAQPLPAPESATRTAAAQSNWRSIRAIAARRYSPASCGSVRWAIMK